MGRLSTRYATCPGNKSLKSLSRHLPGPELFPTNPDTSPVLGVALRIGS